MDNLVKNSRLFHWRCTLTIIRRTRQRSPILGVAILLVFVLISIFIIPALQFRFLFGFWPGDHSYLNEMRIVQRLSDMGPQDSRQACKIVDRFGYVACAMPDPNQPGGAR